MGAANRSLVYRRSFTNVARVASTGQRHQLPPERGEGSAQRPGPPDVKPERPQSVTQMTHADDVPAALAIAESVRIEIALGLVALRRAVAHPHPRLRLGGAGERNERRIVSRRLRPGEIERDRFIDRAHPPLE